MIDNGSDDDSVSYVRKNYPFVKIIEFEINKGFSSAVNAGIKDALRNNSVDFVVLLNNDIECSKNFLEEIIKPFDNISVGSVASKMLNFYQRDVIDDTGNFLSLTRSPWARGHGEADFGQYDEPEQIFSPCAGAAAYRRTVFETVGFFDEDFISYYEDVDFGFRMQIAGFKCHYNPKAICYHKRGATTQAWKGYQTRMCEKNLVALRFKNYPLSLYLICQPFFIAGRIKRYLRFWKYHSFSLFLSAISGYLQGLSGLVKCYKKRREIKKIKVLNTKEIKLLFKEPRKNSVP